ncbi:hypothetical protein SEPCBS119000_000597 [Sporothrix epigloea]|uniref:Uncharacterized protein n=1 Tax=Sporothrix epigloea TaxID=1892477 RepID=A0ABP0D620_9PEZI
MYSPDLRRIKKSRKTIEDMDPDCAICRAPASAQCGCEARGLEIALSQAEKRMMHSVYDDIKLWVRQHARDYILEYFTLLKERRHKSFEMLMERIASQAQYYHTQPYPDEIQQAQMDFRRGINEDWQSSVQRYPEVLDYYYSLVVLNVPSDDDANVRDPPLSALAGNRSSVRRTSGPVTIASGSGGDSAVAPAPLPAPNRISMYSHSREGTSRARTPPTPASEHVAPISDRRTPMPARDRRSYRPPPPGPPSSYYPERY